MYKFFEKKDTPDRPHEYIHKRDEREEIIPIFKYRQPSNPIIEEPKKVEEEKDDKQKNPRNPS